MALAATNPAGLPDARVIPRPPMAPPRQMAGNPVPLIRLECLNALADLRRAEESGDEVLARLHRRRVEVLQRVISRLAGAVAA